MTGRPTSWSSAVQEAVGLAYREAGGRGADEYERIQAGVEAFRAAGGVAAVPWVTVDTIISHLSRDRADWLLEPAHEWALRRHRRYQDGRLCWRLRRAAAHSPDRLEDVT